MSKGFWSGLLDILFPPRCTFCRRFLEKGENRVCAVCKRELPYNRQERSGDFFTVCVAPLVYRDRAREAILRFKFRGATHYAGCFGSLIADCVRDRLAGRWDLITWVPLSAERKRSRGYDQAMLLAMAAALELDEAAPALLKKIRDVPAQSGMGAPEKRRANISGAYAAAEPELIAGRRILLIDDIITTGATLSECARVLLEAGAKEVLCAALASTE